MKENKRQTSHRKDPGELGSSAETSDQRRIFSIRNQIILFLSKSNGPI